MLRDVGFDDVKTIRPAVRDVSRGAPPSRALRGRNRIDLAFRQDRWQSCTLSKRRVAVRPRTVTEFVPELFLLTPCTSVRGSIMCTHGGLCMIEERRAIRLVRSDDDESLAPAGFYPAVTGWGTAQWKGPTPYTMWTVNGTSIGGVMPLRTVRRRRHAGCTSRPDADDTIAQAVALGARMRPGVGHPDGGAVRRPARSAGRRVRDLHAGVGGAGHDNEPRLGDSPGTSWSPMTIRRHTVSTSACSDGRRGRRWTWAAATSIRCSAARA